MLPPPRSRSLRLAPWSLATALLAAASSLTPAAPAFADPTDECSSAAPAWIFCTGFEEGDFDIWDDYDGNPPETNQLVADPGPRHQDGNHVLRLRVPPGRGTADVVKLLPSSHDRLYARWHVKYEPGFDFGASNHGSGLHAGGRSYLGRSGYRPDGDDRFSATIEHSTSTRRLYAYAYYRGMYMDCANPEGACWGDHFPCMVDEGQNYCTRPQHRETVLPPAVQTDRWYCIEMMMDGGTPSVDGSVTDGVLNFWVDGVEIGPWDDLWLRTTPALKLTILWLCLFHHADHSVEGLMFDDVVVSTERIGCGDGGTPDTRQSWGAIKSGYR